VLREHRDAPLLALGGADAQPAGVEVEVLDAQPESLQEAQARAGEERGHQLRHNTTTHREPVRLPETALPIDNPGIRESQPERIVIHCHEGPRSTRATHLLRSAGFRQVHDLAGGIGAYAEEIDPSLARY
jgi:rhodanese-related sulfurtransferase